MSKSETTKEIFNIESEHKRLTENQTVENTTEKGRKTSIHTPINKIRSVTRLAGGPMRGEQEAIDTSQYNPTDSPSVTQFTNKLNDSVPNQSDYRAKHEEEGEESQTEREGETELEELTEVEGQCKLLLSFSIEL